MEEAAHW